MVLWCGMEKQPKNSQLCAPACLAFVLKSLNNPVSTKEISKELPINKEYGIGLFDLARYPILKGYSVDMYAWDGRHFPVKWRKLTKAQLIEDLEHISKEERGWRQALLDSLKRGATFFPHPASTKEIEKRLAQNHQMIMYIDSAVLYQQGDGIWGHYVVLQKTSSQYWTIFDPHWKYGGIKKYPKDLLLFAFYSVGGYCLFILPKDSK